MDKGFVTEARFSFKDVGGEKAPLGWFGDLNGGNGFVVAKKMQASAGREKFMAAEIENNKTICGIDLDDFWRRRSGGTDMPFFSRRGSGRDRRLGVGMCTAEQDEDGEEEREACNAMANHIDVARLA